MTWFFIPETVTVTIQLEQRFLDLLQQIIDLESNRAAIVDATAKLRASDNDLQTSIDLNTPKG